MSTTKKRAELKRLSSEGQRNLFEMLRLADEILKDAEYVDQFGGEASCIDDMEAKEFSHFGRSPTLGMMLKAYRKFPDIAEWRRNRFNIRVMIDLANPREKVETQRTDWKARATELDADNANLKALIDEQSKTISELRAKVEELNGLVGEYRGRVMELEKHRGRRDLAAA